MTVSTNCVKRWSYLQTVSEAVLHASSSWSSCSLLVSNRRRLSCFLYNYDAGSPEGAASSQPGRAGCEWMKVEWGRVDRNRMGGGERGGGGCLRLMAVRRPLLYLLSSSHNYWQILSMKRGTWWKQKSLKCLFVHRVNYLSLFKFIKVKLNLSAFKKSLKGTVWLFLQWCKCNTSALMSSRVL